MPFPKQPHTAELAMAGPPMKLKLGSKATLFMDGQQVAEIEIQGVQVNTAAYGPATFTVDGHDHAGTSVSASGFLEPSWGVTFDGAKMGKVQLFEVSLTKQAFAPPYLLGYVDGDRPRTFPEDPKLALIAEGLKALA